MLALHEVGATPRDLDLLRCFYDGPYTAEFPDPNERESYANMVTYLRAAGTHENGYHIVLALADNRAIGGSVSDYFADSNAGVVEFILTAPEHRGSGLGTALLRDTEGRLVADAQRRGRDLGFIAAEINDPFRRSATPDNVDPFERAGWWDRRGYGKLDFPYVQPALSPEQVPVRNLMLGVKLFAPSQRRAISAPAVDVFLRDYLIHAMRIADPASSAEYVEMSRWLGSRDDVGVISLRKYIGEDPSAGANIHEVTGPDDQ